MSLTLTLMLTKVSLLVKVLMKQISLICFRVYLEVYVVKNPTCFSRWSVRRCEDCIDLDGYVKEPDSDNQFDTEDGFIEVEDNYSLTDYFVKTYCHSGGSYCQKKFREYMYKKFKTKYAKDFLLG